MTLTPVAGGSDDAGRGAPPTPHSPGWLAIAGPPTAIAIAIAGQLSLEGGRAGVGGALLGLAALTLVAALRRGACLPLAAEPQPASSSAPWIAPPALRRALAAGAAFCSVWAWIGFADHRFDRGVLPWLAAIVLWVAAAADHSPRRGSPAPALRRRIEWGTVFALLSVTLLAAFFRFHRLAELPLEMTSDHAEKLLDIHDVLNGEHSIFFPRNTGREPFQFYLTAALIQWTPLSLGFLALKTGAALFSTAAAPLTYLLARFQYGPLTAWLAAALLAVSHWHVAISRVGLRFAFTATFAVAAVLLLLRALRTDRRSDWIGAGLCLGAGLHTYTAMRVVPALFVALVLVATLFALGDRRRGLSTRAGGDPLSLRLWRHAALGGVASLIVALPLLRYSVDQPEGFWDRSASRVLVSGETSATEIAHTLGVNVFNAARMFNDRGDVVPINTIPGSPALDPLPAALFVLGVAALAWGALARRRREDLVLALCCAAMVAPSVASIAVPEENPSLARAGGAVPFVMIAAALPLAVAVDGLWRGGSAARRALALLLAGGCVLTATLQSYRWYFVEYQAHTLRAILQTTELGAVLRDRVTSGARPEDVHHVAYPYWVDTRNIGINGGDIGWKQAVLDLEVLAEHARRETAQTYLVHPDDRRAILALDETFPGGRWKRHRTRAPGQDFLVFDTGPRTTGSEQR